MNQNVNQNGEQFKSLAELAVRRRQEVRRDKELSGASKLLFDDLTDLCFLDKFTVGFGVVRIGKPRLAERLGCSVPTISRAQRALSPAHMWTKTGWHEGHEITLWFLRGIASTQLEFDGFTAGITRMPQTRIAPRIEKTRNAHGQFCTTQTTPDLPQNGPATAELTVHPGQSCHAATVSSARARRSELTVVNGQIDRAGPGRTDRSQRSELTVVNGQIDRAGPGRSDLGGTAEVTVYPDPGNKDVNKDVCGSQNTRSYSPTHAPIPTFEALDRKMVMRLRKESGTDMINHLKAEINYLRAETGSPELILVYRQRIRDIRDWMHGIMRPTKLVNENAGV